MSWQAMLFILHCLSFYDEVNIYTYVTVFLLKIQHINELLVSFRITDKSNCPIWKQQFHIFLTNYQYINLQCIIKKVPQRERIIQGYKKFSSYLHQQQLLLVNTTDPIFSEAAISRKKVRYTKTSLNKYLPFKILQTTKKRILNS